VSIVTFFGIPRGGLPRACLSAAHFQERRAPAPTAYEIRTANRTLLGERSRIRTLAGPGPAEDYLEVARALLVEHTFPSRSCRRARGARSARRGGSRGAHVPRQCARTVLSKIARRITAAPPGRRSQAARKDGRLRATATKIGHRPQGPAARIESPAADVQCRARCGSRSTRRSKTPHPSGLIPLLCRRRRHHEARESQDLDPPRANTCR